MFWAANILNYHIIINSCNGVLIIFKLTYGLWWVLNMVRVCHKKPRGWNALFQSRGIIRIEIVD